MTIMLNNLREKMDYFNIILLENTHSIFTDPTYTY